jgi:hypothetical protein
MWGEMVLVADKTQDVYGTAGVWTDEAMSNSGFRGQWAVGEFRSELSNAA